MGDHFSRKDSAKSTDMIIMKLLSRFISFTDNVRQRNIHCCSGTKFYRTYAKNRYIDYNFSNQIQSTGKNPKGQVHQTVSEALKTRQIDAAIEQILDDGTYSPEHFLVIKDAYNMAPLTALIVCSTETPVTLSVKILDSFGWSYEEKKPGTRHRIPVFALRCGCRNHILLEAKKNGQVISSQKFYIRTAPLPDMLTDMISVRKHTKPSASPLTFVFGGDTKLPYAFDETGEIRYYMTRRPKSYGLLPLSKGRFLFLGKTMCRPSFANPHAVLALEIDYLGRCYHEYYLPDGIHHDGGEMTPGGNLLVVSEHTVEDAITEIDRTTGQIVKKLPLQNILSDHPYFDFYDWAHINTVSYSPKDHSVLVCARNLHSVIKINWETDELLWIFCDTSFWKGTPYEDKVLRPEPDTPFCYQAHAAYFMDDNDPADRRRLVIFDNHWHARRPMETFDGDKRSHVRIYEINENEHTVGLSQTFPCAKTKIRSNAVITRKTIFAMCGYLNKDIDGNSGSIVEFNRKDGSIVNRYLTCNSFYRAYPMKPDCNALTKPVSTDTSQEYLTIASGSPVRCEPVNTADARPLPHQMIRPKTDKKTRQRKVDKYQKMKDNRVNPVVHDIQSELAEMAIDFYDCLLLVGCRDHLVSHIYLCGDDHCYVKDFSNTEQKCAALYGDMRYYSTIPIRDLEKDKYQIYVRCEGVLYDTGRGFEM